ncbi:hypothetical protein QBC46DRAFT_445065 [Diplogelasinospora grovesii]|uniref:Uncharacterized protein n=1 Tax=Diplogelasinospora grovesii TaxID=303347 RepID=A0AAN6SA56_9PEZI|nr:hypothetical protein QBC46DRAFT_445065 [Diplogelasinospora grovesii]
MMADARGRETMATWSQAGTVKTNTEDRLNPNASVLYDRFLLFHNHPWAESVVNPPARAAAAAPDHWRDQLAIGISHFVIWVDGMLSPFKLEDQDHATAAEDRATAAEDRLGEGEEHSGTTLSDIDALVCAISFHVFPPHPSPYSAATMPPACERCIRFWVHFWNRPWDPSCRSQVEAAASFGLCRVPLLGVPVSNDALLVKARQATRSTGYMGKAHPSLVEAGIESLDVALETIFEHGLEREPEASSLGISCPCSYRGALEGGGRRTGTPPPRGGEAIFVEDEGDSDEEWRKRWRRASCTTAFWDNIPYNRFINICYVPVIEVVVCNVDNLGCGACEQLAPI